jgi:hypothetical protein
MCVDFDETEGFITAKNGLNKGSNQLGSTLAKGAIHFINNVY